MEKARCKECGWRGTEDQLISTSVSISFVHCPRCGSDNTATELEELFGEEVIPLGTKTPKPSGGNSGDAKPIGKPNPPKK